MTTLGFLILAFVVVQRLSELVIAKRNTARLLDQGGYEVGANHYPLIVLMHAAWLISLFYLAWDKPINYLFLAIYIVLQVLRLWVLTSIGKRWTTRIIIVPGEQLVRKGPYKFISHPNYAVVVAEIACLPLVFGLWQLALIFSILNALMLTLRIRVEAQALANPKPA